MDLSKEIKKLQQDFLKEIKKIKDSKTLTDLEIKYLGRKGEMTRILRGLKDMAAEERPKIGSLANLLKTEISSEIAKIKAIIKDEKETEKVDITAPGIKPALGHLHLVTQAIREIEEIFSKIGFTRVRYPEVEWDYYTFESLNMPPGHPARDEWETFFIDSEPVSRKGQRVLTPHSTSGDVREMEKGKLPIRIINITKCYRRQIDISHTPMFHQFDGLLVDKGITVSHLKGTMDYFVKKFFGPNRKVRLRPSHFRFTEPSIEVDVSCGVCRGRGCRLCKAGWLELAGSGQVHPKVLKAGGVDSKKYSGFAFGWGVERTYMMKEGLNIPDIRLLYQNDLRFLNQF